MTARPLNESTLDQSSCSLLNIDNVVKTRKEKPAATQAKRNSDHETPAFARTIANSSALSLMATGNSKKKGVAKGHRSASNCSQRSSNVKRVSGRSSTKLNEIFKSIPYVNKQERAVRVAHCQQVLKNY